MRPKDPKYSIWVSEDDGVSFGKGKSDIYINSNSDTNKMSFSNLGNTYVHPSFQNGSNEAKCFLAGSYNFSTSEIEVFKVE